MSIVDKVVAAVTPPESAEARAEARNKARAAAQAGDWLSLVLDHHVQLEAAFAAVKGAVDSGAQRAAEKQLTGHAIAEESVIYPALALSSEKGHASTGYTEQAAVKVQMAALEKLAPMSRDYLDKLEHIRGAVAHHMYEEEGNWFLALKKKAPAADQSTLTQRYEQEFHRYVGADAVGGAPGLRL
jgi:hypothetical protein